MKKEQETSYLKTARKCAAIIVHSHLFRLHLPGRAIEDGEVIYKSTAKDYYTLTLKVDEKRAIVRLYFELYKGARRTIYSRQRKTFASLRNIVAKDFVSASATQDSGQADEA